MRRALFCLLLLLPALLGAETGSMPIPLGSLGMGSAYLTAHDSPLAMIHNPAMLGLPIRHPFQIGLTGMLNADGFRLLSGTAADIKKYAPLGISAAPDDLLTTLQSFNARYRMGVDIAWRGEGVGILIYGNGQGRVNFSGATIPSGDMQLDQDTCVVIGLGVPVTLSKKEDIVFLAGINIRYVNRIRFQETAIPFADAGGIVDPFDMHTDFLMGQAVSSDMALSLIAGRMTFTIAWRNWFGMRFSWTSYDSQWNDTGTVIGDSVVKPGLDFGMAVRFRTLFGLPREIFSETVLALDVRGFLQEEHSFFNMLHAGVSTVFLNFLTLKFGFSRGYPTWGISTTLFNFVTLEYAMYTAEEGVLPGQNPATLHAFSLTLLF